MTMCDDYNQRMCQNYVERPHDEGRSDHWLSPSYSPSVEVITGCLLPSLRVAVIIDYLLPSLRVWK